VARYRFFSLLAGVLFRRRHRFLAPGCAVLAAVLLLPVLLLAQPQAAAPASAPPQAGGGYVGSDTCRTCHEDIYTKHFENTPHAALLKQGKHGCEDCHGPGQAHVEGGGDVTKIIRFEKLSPAQASARCLTCHQTSLENTDFSRSVHLSQGVGCLSCHSPHHATDPNHLMVKAQPLLCYGCHATQKAEFMRPFRHRVEAGLMVCTDCHNPHGTFTTRQLRTNPAGELMVCTKCHTETQGPFVYEHAPVRTEGCTICHQPHGATSPRMLRVTNVNILCMQCHTPTAMSGVPGLPTFHNQSLKYQACTMCHAQIHGSNFDEFFFK
jgi:DmsE family decaheme c-type cytochrome